MKEITKKEIYIEYKNNCIKKIAGLDIEILVLERTDPKKIIGHKPTMQNDKGQTIASVEVPAGELLKEYKGQRDGFEIRLGVIESLL